MKYLLQNVPKNWPAQHADLRDEKVAATKEKEQLRRKEEQLRDERMLSLKIA